MVHTFSAFLCLFLLSCNPEPDRSEKQEPTDSVRSLYLSASERLQTSFLENGWVVSRKPDGKPQHTGDSLLWSGLALGALPCDQGDAIEANLIDTVTRHKGGLVRYEPVASPVSLDGAIGFWHGIAHRIACPGKAALWAPTVSLHADFLTRSKNHLSDETDEVLPPSYDYVPELLNARLNGSRIPDSNALGVLRTALAFWTKAVVDNRRACYRIHLALLTMETLDALGKGESRANFCIAGKGAAMPLVDHFCGQPQPLLTWIEHFEYNAWENAHQRCAGWESPDGNGNTSPGLDLIVALKRAYQL